MGFHEHSLRAAFTHINCLVQWYPWTKPNGRKKHKGVINVSNLLGIHL
jgi:hypothetical protein